MPAHTSGSDGTALGLTAAVALADRDEFLTYVEAACRTSTARAESALLRLHVDHLRPTLQTYRGAAEAVVGRLALLLFETSGRHAFIGRLGLDEFGVVLPAAAKARPTDLARALVHRVAGTDFGGQDAGPLYLTASVGVAPIVGPEQPLDEILCTADAALRVARSAGGNRAFTLRPGDARAIAERQAVRTLPRLRDAIHDGRLLLHCQPIVPLHSPGERLPAAELLVRLATADGEVLQPAQFLPVAERFRLTAAIDREVLARACHWLESRASSWVDLEYLSVNLHARSLDDAELVDGLLRRLALGRFPAGRLCLEVGGAAHAAEPERVLHQLQQLHDAGCRVALDDFGAAGVALADFARLPVDIVKLDGAFMDGLPDDAGARELLGWVCDLCRAHGRSTVAERCGTPAVLEAVRALGVDYAQGHAVCEPFALDQLLPTLPPQLAPVA